MKHLVHGRMNDLMAYSDTRTARPTVTFSLALLLSLAVVIAPFEAPRAAQNVGVAAAVLPDAKSTRPDQSAKVLRIGVDIVANERVTTDAKGKLQLLFLDGSALTVGPNSDVVVDRFVYDPVAKTGQLAFSATKGLFRLVGGRISKKTPVILKLPEAVIGIRGGIASVHATAAGVIATFIFGEGMTVESGGVSVSVDRPGFQISAQPGKAPSPPAPVSEQQISADMNALESGPGQAEDSEVKIGDEDVANSQLAAMGSAEPPQLITVVGAPPPPTDASKVIISDKLQNDVANVSQQNAMEGNTGGLTLTGFYGRAKRGTSPDLGTFDNDATQNLALSGISINGGRFSVSTSQGAYNLRGPVAPGTFSLTSGDSSPFGAVTGTGFLSVDQQFLLYELFSSRQLVFAGVPTPSSAVPTSGVTTFNVRDDFTLGGSNIPLIPASQGGSLTPLSTPQAMIYWGASGSGALPSFFSANLAITGSGSSQKHAVSIMVGAIRTDEANRPFFSGHGAGTSLISSTANARGFGGDIATADAGDGSDFFGLSGPKYAVIVAEEVNSVDVISGRDIEDEPTGTMDTIIFPNIPLIGTTNAAGIGATRTTRVMAAYTGGMARDFDNAGGFLGTHLFYSINTTATTTVNGISVPINRVQTSVATNNVEGAFNFMSPFSDGTPNSVLDFGSLLTSMSEDSGFIDDGHFAAVGFEAGMDEDINVGMFRNTDISLASLTPSGHTICTCSFITWGFWAGAVDPSTEHEIALAPWVAGVRVANSVLFNGASGSFSGTLIGNVAAGPHETNGAVGVYTAVGTYSFNVNIAPGSLTVSSGTLSIDGATLTFPTGTFSTSGPAPFAFSGTLSGTRGATALSGNIKGGFFGTPPNSSSVPRNAAGFFFAHDSAITYQISGVHFSEVAP